MHSLFLILELLETMLPGILVDFRAQMSERINYVKNYGVLGICVLSLNAILQLKVCFW